MLARPPRPLPLPRVTHADNERARRAAFVRAPISLPNATGFSIRMVSDADDIPEPDNLVLVELTLGRAPLRAAVPRQLITELIGSLGNPVDLATMPADILGVLLEAALASLLVGLEQAVGQPVAIRAVRGETAPTGTALLLVAPDRVWPFTVGGDAASMDLLLRRWPAAERDMDWLPMPARPRIGATTLPLSVLRSLRVGDLVLLETALPPIEGPDGLLRMVTLVVSERVSAQAAVHGTAIELVSPVGPVQGEWFMSGADDTTGDAGLDDVPVRLAFDLGQVDMPLGEVRGLGAGMVVELGRSAGDYVDIQANGRRIGRGELVDLDGKLGVRIIRIFARE